LLVVLVALPAIAAEPAKKDGPKAAAPDVKFDLKLDDVAKPDLGGAQPGTAKPAKGPDGKPLPPKPALDLARMPFDHESIRQVVKFHMSEVQDCYEKVLADTGLKIEGRAVVGFVIDGNGNVTEARPLAKKSTLKDDRVLDCLLAVRTWAFPKPPDIGDHPIEYPFDLKVTK